MKNFLTFVFGFGGIALCLFLLVLDVRYQASRTEVESYTIGMEISQMAYAEEAVNKHTTRPVYKMGLRNNDFALVIEIEGWEFAKYTVGEIAEVKVIVYEYMDGAQEKEYKLNH